MKDSQPTEVNWKYPPHLTRAIWIRPKENCSRLPVQRLPTAAFCKARPQQQTPAAPSLALKVYTHTVLLVTASDADIWLPMVFRCMKHATG